HSLAFSTASILRSKRSAVTSGAAFLTGGMFSADLRALAITALRAVRRANLVVPLSAIFASAVVGKLIIERADIANLLAAGICGAATLPPPPPTRTKFFAFMLSSFGQCISTLPPLILI